MRNETTNTAVPKLRFPEFREAEEWEERNLGQAGEFIGGGTPETSKSEYWDGEIQWFTPTEIKDRFHSKSKRTITAEGLRNSSAKMLPKGALLLTTRATIGDISIAENPCTTNQGFQSFVVNSTEDNSFWYYWFIQHKGELVRRASGSTFPEIGKTQIVKIPALSPSKAEQQKIAATLSSLDDLLTAHSAKLAALQAHKRGLMQGLFPAEGETVPKLRFPAFREAEEWEEKTLESLSLKISDGIHTTPRYDEAGEYYFINGNNLVDGIIYVDEKTKRVSEEEFNKYKKDLNENTVFISINGTIGNVSIYNNEKVVLGKSACYINTDPAKLNKEYLTNLLKTERTYSYFKSEVTGSTIMNLSLKTIKNMIVNLPSKAEQQKIADCLSSLDNRINAQSQKIEALKLHKKGLMQGLFPAAAEPTA